MQIIKTALYKNYCEQNKIVFPQSGEKFNGIAMLFLFYTSTTGMKVTCNVHSVMRKCPFSCIAGHKQIDTSC